jgi:hypothetical protein
MKRLITWLYCKYVLIPQLRKMEPEIEFAPSLVDELLNVEYSTTEIEWVIDNRSIH